MNAPDALPPFLHRPPETGATCTLTLAETEEGPRWRFAGDTIATHMVAHIFPGARATKGDKVITFPALRGTFLDLLMILHRHPTHIAATARDLFEEFFRDAIAEHLGQDEATRAVPRCFKGELMPFQAEGVQFMHRGRRTVLADEMGLGKRLALGTPILAPSGWRPIEDLRVGDKVVGVDGLPHPVTGTFRDEDRPLYRVTFSDGVSIDADDEHLWEVQHVRNDTEARYPQTNGRWRVMTTAQILEAGVVDGSANRTWRIPLVAPVQFPEVELPADPYLIGVAIGDGSHAKGDRWSICTDIEILEAVGAERIRPHPKSEGIGYGVVRISGLSGRAWEKRIPEAYLWASEGQRRALLAGLLDTDGHVNCCGTVQYSTSSEGLAADVTALVQSLGGTATINIKEAPRYPHKGEMRTGRPCHIVTIRLAGNPFRLTRKASKWKPLTKYAPTRIISSVERIPNGPGVCITVDAPRNLYVAAHHVVTHNSVQAMAWIDRLQQYPVVIVAQPHILTHWRKMVEQFLGARDTAPQKDLFAPELPPSDGPSYTVLRGQKPALATRQADIYITHYLLLQFWDGWLRARGVRAIVFDECQEMRHGGTEKSKACASLSRSVKFVGGLSGTPIYNYGIEIFQVLNTIAPGSLGLKTHFQREWCDGAQVVRDPEGLGAYLTSRRLMLRRRKEEVLAQLPPIRRVVEPIDGNENVFHKLVAKAASLAAEAEYQRNPFDKARMQAEAVAETRRATGVAKAPAVAAFVRGLVEAGEAPIVFAHHHAVVDELTMSLSDLAPVRITGRESLAEKAKSQAQFENGAASLIIIGLRASTGLDGLQKRAKCVVFAELDWSPAVHWQGEGRAHRIGQEDSVLAYYLTIGFGTDPAMLMALGLKGEQFFGIMQDETPGEADALAGQQAAQKHMDTVLEMLRERYPENRERSDGSEAA